jgi:hypothetical protein
MNSRTVGPTLVGGPLVVAAVCAVGVDHGWWIAAPVLLAVAVVAAIRAKLHL